MAVNTKKDQVLSVRLHSDDGRANELPVPDNNPGVTLLEVAKAYPEAEICWRDPGFGDIFSPPSTWPDLLQHRLEMRFSPGPPGDDMRLATLALAGSYTPFLMPAHHRAIAPSWLVSPVAGVCHTGLLACFRAPRGRWSLRQILTAVARQSMTLGGCAYADARLLRGGSAQSAPAVDAPWREIAALVAQHYGPKAPLSWLIGVLLLRKRLPLISALAALGQKGTLEMDRQALEALRPTRVTSTRTAQVDAVIPTLHRPDHLVRILEDLAVQNHLPARVRVVAQGADSVPAGIENRHWPFDLAIQHVSWFGACRARNSGIAETESKWVLLADDDVRLPPDYVEQMLSLALAYGVDAVNAIPYETQVLGIRADVMEWNWSNFLSGFALCKRDILLAAGGFQERMEGIIFEDYELGVRLRHAGTHILVTRTIAVVNLGAPTGGFRSPEIALVRPPGRELPPGLAVFFSLHDRMTRAMRLGFKLYYPRALLRSLPWWRWPTALARLTADWRAARKWFSDGR